MEIKSSNTPDNDPMSEKEKKDRVKREIKLPSKRVGKTIESVGAALSQAAEGNKVQYMCASDGRRDIAFEAAKGMLPESDDIKFDGFKIHIGKGFVVFTSITDMAKPQSEITDEAKETE